MVLLLEALLMTLIFGFNSLELITIKRLSASDGKQAMIPLAFSTPALIKISSSTAFPWIKIVLRNSSSLFSSGFCQ